MKEKLETIFRHLTGPAIAPDIMLPDGPSTAGEDRTEAVRCLNASFLISLSGSSHPLYKSASQYLDAIGSHPEWKNAVHFYREGINHIPNEISHRYDSDADFSGTLDALCKRVAAPGNSLGQNETVEGFRRLFFPEGASLSDKREEMTGKLRRKRTVKIRTLNTSPVTDPAKEVLITSNVLVTIPAPSMDIEGINVEKILKQTLKRVIEEEQLYWYDHPVPIGVEPGHNEVLYGLQGLDDAVEFEKQRGTLDRNARVTCILSVSVTHKGLQGLVKDYLEDELRKEKNIRHLDLYVFSESDTLRLIEDILIPFCEKYSDMKDSSLLYDVIGVDGEYGRHYSFLKAVAAFWQVFINSEIKGTFKIDLDQVFPQKELTEQSGLSAFEHFRTPIWGAEGIDSDGNAVKLGMIAGALVNQEDISNSLFTPDVSFPTDKPENDELIFFSRLPQALSTEAEMMTRYNNEELDGKKHCIQRVHVTGGTNGILVNDLRKYKPFTPTFIGRAEDQAYILSVLFNDDKSNLRYVHKDGLIMRHDKKDFAGEAIRMAAAGKIIGDYIRTLMFSYYVKALPWNFGDIKKAIDPFTGCFVSGLPVTVVYLRFALKLASIFKDDSDKNNLQGVEFFEVGIKRLGDTIRQLTSEPGILSERFNKEKKAWSIFYKILDRAEEGIKKSDPVSLQLQEKANELVKNCRINFGNS